jgi:hypothetical protein
MNFDTSVIHNDCIYIVHVEVGQDLIDVKVIREIGQNADETPINMQLKKEGERILADDSPDLFRSKIISAIEHHIRRGSGGPYRRAI